MKGVVSSQRPIKGQEEQEIKPARLFYGWVIVAVCFVVLAIAYTLRYSYPVFFVALQEKFGWSRGHTALGVSITLWVYGLMNPVAGSLLDRMGPRRLFSAGAIIMSLGFLASSQMTQLWHYYLFTGGVAAVGMSALGVVANNTILASWFIRKRGTAIGLANSGMGVGMVTLIPLTQIVIDRYGFGWAYGFLGVMVAVIVIPLAAIFLRGRPEEKGLQPDGDPPAARNPSGPALSPSKRGERRETIVNREWVTTEWTLSQALKTYQFWALFASSILLLIGLYGVMMHQVSHAVDVGFSKMMAASAFGIIGLMGAIGKAGWGFLSDRIGREQAYSLGLLSTVIGIAFISLLQDASQIWLLYAYTAFFGLGYGVVAPLTAAVTADLFQGRGLGAIYGTVVLAAGIGGGIGPALAGYAYDTLGSYRLAFHVAAVLIVLSGGLIWVASPRKVRLVAGKARVVAE